MKKIFFKSIAIAITTSLFCTTSLSAQGFLNKLKKATDKVESVSKTVESVTGATTASTEQGTDSISPKEFLEKAPSYTVKKVIETDSLGKAITNEDGTTRYSYLLIDKDGKVCEKNAVRKHLNSALKSGTFILLKVGGGATAGALAGKKIGGSKSQLGLVRE